MSTRRLLAALLLLAGCDAPARPWVATTRGVGAVTAGMSVAEVERALGAPLPPAADPECAFVAPPGAPPGVELMLVRDTVARVDVATAAVPTVQGVRVGDATDEARRRLGPAAREQPHKYVPGGITLELDDPAGAPFALVLEAERDTVRRFRVGRRPEVTWVERCG